MPIVSSQMLGPTSFLSSVMHGGASGDGVEARAAEEGGRARGMVNSPCEFIYDLHSINELCFL